MNLGGYTAIGPRDANEDNFYFLDFPDVHSFTNGVTSYIMVSDGMGGYQGGDIASGLAVSSAESYLSQLLDMAEGNQVDFDAPYALGEISQNAHDAILAEASGRGNVSMGATFIGAFLSPTRAWIGHVGDSRAYLIRDNMATQLTEDHSQVGRMLSRGLISEEEAQNHPARNRIERALGFSDATPDITEVDLQPGDALLLCSDGVYTVLSCQAIADCVCRSKDAATAAKRVVKTALGKGTDDNSTAVVALCVDAPQDESAKRASQPTIRTNVAEHARHAAAGQFDETTRGAEDPLKGLDEFVSPELRETSRATTQTQRGRTPAPTQQADSVDLEQYRTENYRGRTSGRGREGASGMRSSGTRPSVSERGSSTTGQGRSKKALVVPLALGVALLVAIVAIALFTTQCGSGGAMFGGQQASAPPAAEQATAEQAEASNPPDASPETQEASPMPGTSDGTGLAEYMVGANAELKYIDSQDGAHTFDEGLENGVGFKADAPVLLLQGARVQAGQEPIMANNVGKFYYVLDSSFRQDLLNDLQSYNQNPQVTFVSSLSATVADKSAYRDLIKAISEWNSGSAQSEVAKLVVSESDENGYANLLSASIPQQ